MTVGSTIRAAREAAGLTQEELGKKCGTTKQTIYKYETGKIENIPKGRIKKIASVLGISPLSIADFDTASEIISYDMDQKLYAFGSEGSEKFMKLEYYFVDFDEATRDDIVAYAEYLAEHGDSIDIPQKIAMAYSRASEKEKQTVRLILSDYLTGSTDTCK